MHWDCIAYDKHSRALHWDCIVMIDLFVQCIGIKLLMTSIVVLCKRIKQLMHWIALLMISRVVQCIGMHCL